MSRLKCDGQHGIIELVIRSENSDNTWMLNRFLLLNQTLFVSHFSLFIYTLVGRGTDDTVARINSLIPRFIIVIRVTSLVPE